MKTLNIVLVASTISMISVSISACGVSSPTYGTDKTTSEQLMSDFSNLVTFRSANNNAIVNTKPRPDLVKPVPGVQPTDLPPPQTNVAKPGTPDWPESPEEKRKRLRAEATANQGNPRYVSPIIGGKGKDVSSPIVSTQGLNGLHREHYDPALTKKQRDEFLRRQKENMGGDAQTRKYLSEPPLEYRQPATTAPVGDKGVDESKKERERAKALKGESGKKSWWPF